MIFLARNNVKTGAGTRSPPPDRDGAVACGRSPGMEAWPPSLPAGGLTAITIGVMVVVFVLPGALLLAMLALVGFVWALKSGQFEDPAGDAARILQDEERPG